MLVIEEMLVLDRYKLQIIFDREVIMTTFRYIYMSNE
jgi:hypothetical protein